MTDKEYSEKEREWCNMQKRYQFTITSLLVVIGFFIGMTYQSSKMTKQLTVNTVRIDVLEGKLNNIENKLDRLLQESIQKSKDKSTSLDKPIGEHNLLAESFYK